MKHSNGKVVPIFSAKKESTCEQSCSSNGTPLTLEALADYAEHVSDDEIDRVLQARGVDVDLELEKLDAMFSDKLTPITRSPSKLSNRHKRFYKRALDNTFDLLSHSLSVIIMVVMSFAFLFNNYSLNNTNKNKSTVSLASNTKNTEAEKPSSQYKKTSSPLLKAAYTKNTTPPIRKPKQPKEYIVIDDIYDYNNNTKHASYRIKANKNHHIISKIVSNLTSDNRKILHSKLGLISNIKNNDTVYLHKVNDLVYLIEVEKERGGLARLVYNNGLFFYDEVSDYKTESRNMSGSFTTYLFDMLDKDIPKELRQKIVKYVSMQSEERGVYFNCLGKKTSFDIDITLKVRKGQVIGIEKYHNGGYIIKSVINNNKKTRSSCMDRERTKPVNEPVFINASFSNTQPALLAHN